MTRAGRNSNGAIWVQLGRVLLFLWTGSWSWVHSFRCAHCFNLYIGPFGIEVERDG